MNGKFSRFLLVALVAGGLNACGGLASGTVLDTRFWAQSMRSPDNDIAELGLAELAKGNFGAAETHFNNALERNPGDVHALLGAGMLYKHTGRTTKAREMFEAILALRPERSKQLVVWSDLTARPISEIASVNLALLESGGVLGEMGGGRQATTPGSLAVTFGTEVAQPMPGTGSIVGGAATGRPLATTMGAIPQSPATSASAAAEFAGFGGGEGNIVSRFTTLVALRDQGLITEDEFQTRRQANIGALLPLTSPPAAVGLDRPVPDTEQISGRLRALGRALEMRAISIRQHASERSMIVDALMPAAPVSVASPALPPRGLMEAADAVRRLEWLNANGFISIDEYAKERAAIESALRSAPGVAASQPTAMIAAPVEAAAPAPSSGPQPAVHLASYRTTKAAEGGWAQLRRAHQNLLGGLTPEITKVDLGPGKGIFYRLKVGPLESSAAAKDLCGKLKLRRQYCEPSFMGTS